MRPQEAVFAVLDPQHGTRVHHDNAGPHDDLEPTATDDAWAVRGTGVTWTHPMSYVDSLQRLRADKTRFQFEELHPHAFLISSTWRRAPKFSELLRQSAPQADPLATTFITPRSDESPQASLAPQSNDFLILPVLKAVGNAFQERISVGRAPNCDIIIRDASVSKLHGYFSAVTRDSVIYTDARSSNSTYIDGVTVQPGAPVEIRALGLIALGRVRLQLVSAAELYEWL
jgi:hypothetical protein